VIGTSLPNSGLREGPVRFEGIAFTDSFGVIHVLSATEYRIKLRFTGIVDDVRTGEDDGRSTLMPTWYEWLKATGGLSTLLAAAVYFFGLALALVRWWASTLKLPPART
jgi:hypothetical protein